jgi:hypothetical protein
MDQLEVIEMSSGLSESSLTSRDWGLGVPEPVFDQ